MQKSNIRMSVRNKAVPEEAPVGRLKIQTKLPSHQMIRSTPPRLTKEDK